MMEGAVGCTVCGNLVSIDPLAIHVAEEIILGTNLGVAVG
jgi:hypothetical protein